MDECNKITLYKTKPRGIPYFKCVLYSFEIPYYPCIDKIKCLHYF